jgi:hypothetical protein
MLIRLYSSFFCFSILFSCITHANAQTDFEQKKSAIELKQEAHRLQLANNPVWQKLILFKKHAEVTSHDFYLSDLKAEHLTQITPQRELDATIEALSSHPELICQYPARYYWLSRQLSDMPTAALDGCNKLPNINQDVRLLLVSGYLKNPVSTFGHALITIGAQDERQNLLDSAYNYGAQIPKGDNSFYYVFKGLFGLYSARFANSQFFKQDIIYARTEQRDIWAYTLNLTPEQKTLFIYHLAELQSHSIDYYFIKQNCAYRLAELLEVISDIKITNRMTPWYMPEYVFDQIEEYRKIHPDFIKSVEYLPSDQNKLYFTFKNFPKAVQHEINHYIQTGDLRFNEKLQVSDQEKILEFLIAYLNFKQISDDSTQYQTQKKQLIQKRIQLPVSTEFESKMPSLPSSGLGEKPSKLGFGVGQQRGYFNFTLFNKDLLSAYSNPHNEFKMLDVSLILQKNQLQLQSVDLIHILKIEDMGQQLAGERKFSWTLAAGVKQDIFSGELHRPYVRGGMGLGYDFSPNLIGYSMLSAELNDSAAKIDAVSETALVYHHDAFGFKLSQLFQQRQNKALANDTRFELKYRVTKNTDLRLLLSHRDNYLAYQYFW